MWTKTEVSSRAAWYYMWEIYCLISNINTDEEVKEIESKLRETMHIASMLATSEGEPPLEPPRDSVDKRRRLSTLADMFEVRQKMIIDRYEDEGLEVPVDEEEWIEFCGEMVTDYYEF